MPFTASTRDVMKTLGVMDAKTLHRRREDYNDKSVNPDSQFLKLGVHFLRKSPSSKQLVWDLDTVFGKEATWGNWRDGPNIGQQTREVLTRFDRVLKSMAIKVS